MSDGKNFCLIRQPAGIGDIFFTQKIAKLILVKGKYNKVIWPVAKEFAYIADYMGTNDIVFVNQEEDFPGKDLYNSGIKNKVEDVDSGVLYIPLQSADEVVTLPDYRAHGHMKYKFCDNLPHSDWKDYFTFNRNVSRELKLIDELGINVNTEYNLINRNYGSPPSHKTYEEIKPKNDYSNVYMDYHDQYHLFDWLTVAENATEVHTMESALCYLLEKLDLENVYVYSKYIANYGGADNFEYIKSNYSDKWNFVR